LRPPEQLSRPVDWSLVSRDQSTIITADTMPDIRIETDQALWQRGFVPAIRIWNSRTGTVTHAIQVSDAVGDVLYAHSWTGQWLDDSHVIIVRLLRETRDRTAARLKVIVVDTRTGRLTKVSEDFKYVGDKLIISPDHQRALIMADNSPSKARDIFARTYVLNLQSLQVVSSWEEPRNPKAAAWRVFYATAGGWLPNSEIAFTVDNDWDETNRRPAPRIHLWDVQKGQLINTLAGHSNFITDVTTTSDGKKVLTASADKTARVWDCQTGNLEFELKGHASVVNRILVLSGDMFAITAAEDSTAKVWDLSSGALNVDLAGHDGAVRQVEELAGKRVRTVTVRGTSTIWDRSSGKKLEVIAAPAQYPRKYGKCVLFEKDDKLQMRVNSNP
jgi:WD40 repeat protein